MNIGFKEALMIDSSYQCVFLHDVDLLPENDFNLYSCPEVGRSRQMSFSINVLENYKYIKCFTLLNLNYLYVFFLNYLYGFLDRHL